MMQKAVQNTALIQISWTSTSMDGFILQEEFWSYLWSLD